MNGQPRRPEQPRPSLGPTRPATLVVAALVAAALAWVGISQFYYTTSFPRLPWLPAATMAALALLEAVAATSTKARIDRKPGTRPVDPLGVARLVVLAKASSFAGAILLGLYAGGLVWLLGERGRQVAAAAADVPPAAGGVGAAVALIAAALWLEYACRVPRRPDDKDSDGAPPR